MPVIQDSQDRFSNLQQIDHFSDLKTQIKIAEILPLAEKMNLGLFSTRLEQKSNRQSISKVRAGSIHDKDNSLFIEKPDKNVEVQAPSLFESEILLGPRNSDYSPVSHKTIDKPLGVQG